MAGATPLSEALIAALAEVLPDVDRERLAAAVRAATSRVDEAPEPDEAGDEVVDRYVARVAAAPSKAARAELLRELADVLEKDHEDTDRALSALLGAFEEAPRVGDLDRLVSLARWTGRWNEVDGHLETVLDGAADLDDDARASISLALATIRRDGLRDPKAALASLERARSESPWRTDALHALAGAYDAEGQTDKTVDVLATLAQKTMKPAQVRAALFRDLAARTEKMGDLERAAQHAERALELVPDDAAAHDTLARIYRTSKEWARLASVLERRANLTDGTARGELLLEIAEIYDRKLADDDAALEHYRAADALDPGRADVLSAIVRLLGERDAHAKRIALERLADVTADAVERAGLLRRAGEIAWSSDRDAEMAIDLLGCACDANPDDVDTVRALAELYRDRGDRDRAADLLEETAARDALRSRRSALLCDAAEAATLRGRVIDLYRAARAAEPADPRATRVLAEQYADDLPDHERVVVLAEVCADEAIEAPVRAARLRRLADAAAAIGDRVGSMWALISLMAVEPDDSEARTKLARHAYAAESWAMARTLIEAELEESESDLAPAECAELHFSAGRCANQLGDHEGARIHMATTLALDPSHRDALELRAQLDAADPLALVTLKLALAQAAPPDERGALLVEVGDLYVGLGDQASARAIYSEALILRPTDHALLTKCLDIIADQRDWAGSLDVLEKIIATEHDPAVRARYAHLAAVICRDELDTPDAATTRLWQAVDTDPGLFNAADDLEALLADASPEDRALFYYRRLEQLRTRQARDGETVRLWDQLAAACLELGRKDDAACALEVATRLEPAAADRRHKLADLYIEAGVDGYDRAILQHQEILRATKHRVASYEALLSLYLMTSQFEKARAVDEALAVIMPHVSIDRPPPVPEPMKLRDTAPTIPQKEWSALAFSDVDRLVSALVARIAPVLGSERIVRPEAVDQPRLRDGDASRFAKVFRHVASSLGVAGARTHIDPDQVEACKITLLKNRGVIAPVVVLGRPALTTRDDRALAFAIGRRLADLHPDRFARVLCPRVTELARIVELAIEIASADEKTAGGAVQHASKWLTDRLHPVDLDQVIAIGQLLRDRNADPVAAAQAWLDGTDRVADRIGIVLAGDLSTALRTLSPTSRPDHLIDLVWTSITEETFSIRSRLESWPTTRSSTRTA
jgi:tetratricopeptide (TPR) repeat protein